MKTVKKDNSIKRIKENQVDEFLSNGWELCPKHEWKKIREQGGPKDTDDEHNVNNQMSEKKKRRLRKKNKANRNN